MGHVVADKKAFRVAQISRLFEGSGVRAFYMAERVTCQLGDEDDLVPMSPLQFTLFHYEAPDEIVNLWQSGFPYLDWLEEDNNFKEY